MSSLRAASGRVVHRMPPTARQAIVLRFIAWSVRENGSPPTYAEIARHMGITRGAAADHIRGLERRSLIESQAFIARSIALTAHGCEYIAQHPEPVSGIVSRENITGQPGEIAEG